MSIQNLFEKKEEEINIRIEPSRLDELRIKAKREGLNLSEYIRRKVKKNE